MPTYQDEKGKWYYRVYVDDIFGNRKQKQGSGFATKKEAQKAERELVMLGIVGECNMTFEELWNKYDEFIKLKGLKQLKSEGETKELENGIEREMENIKENYRALLE